MHKIIGFIPWGFSSTNPPENATDSARNRFEEQGLLLGSGGLPVARVTVTGSRVSGLTGRGFKPLGSA
jgi:hypothetical protein